MNEPDLVYEKIVARHLKSVTISFIRISLNKQRNYHPLFFDDFLSTPPFSPVLQSTLSL
jgi:hypothetical protein